MIARALLPLLFLLGCGEEERSAPVEPEGPVAGSSPRATLDQVKVRTDLSALRRAIAMYKTDHEGALPPDLGSLGVSGLHYAEHYEYDPATGDVSCPELPDI